MRKKLLSSFYASATELVARHEKAAKACMGTVYGLGDALVITIPPFENGFIQTLIDTKPDWNLLAVSYGDRPLPILVSCLFVVSAIAIGRGRFALGHAGTGIGAALLIKDFYSHNEFSAALSILPSIAGSAFGTFYLPLERRYENAKNWIVRETLGKPKKLAGYFFFMTSVPTVFSSYLAGNWALFASGINWFTGNAISTLLPRDSESKIPTEPQGKTPLTAPKNNRPLVK